MTMAWSVYMHFFPLRIAKNGFSGNRKDLREQTVPGHARDMHILGLDPGLATIGLGIVEVDARGTLQAKDWLTICTKAGVSLADRLVEIRTDFAAYLDQTQPDLAVVEQLFFAANEQSALPVAHARGVLLVTLAERGIPLLEPTPLAMKACITGDGRADKHQVQDMLCRMLSLAKAPHPDDAADALALAVYGALQQTSPLTTTTLSIPQRPSHA